jgi:hypothetical protein
MRPPSRHVVAGQNALLAFAAGVQHFRVAAEAIDRLGDKALGPDAPRRLHLFGAVGTRRLRLVEQAPPGRRQLFVGQQRAGLRQVAARQPLCGRLLPFDLEQVLDGLDGLDDPRHHRHAVLRIADRRLEQLCQGHRAVVAQHQHPGVEGPGDAGRQQPRARDDLQAQPPVMFDGCAGGRRSLAADHLRLAGLRGMLDQRHVACRPVQVRFRHLQDHPRGHRSIEGVTAALQNTHSGRRGQPVGRGDDTESA